MICGNFGELPTLTLTRNGQEQYYFFTNQLGTLIKLNKVKKESEIK